jgi:hypothetical protein
MEKYRRSVFQRTEVVGNIITDRFHALH